jgi:hypothetical protein
VSFAWNLLLPAYVLEGQQRESAMKQQTTVTAGPDPGLDRIVRLLKSLRHQMPFLLALTPRERRMHRRVDRTILSQLRLTLETAQKHHIHLPTGFQLAEFTGRVGHVLDLQRCLRELEALTTDLRNTLRASVTEAVFHAQVVRLHLQIASRNSSGLAMEVQRLSARRARRARSRKGINKPNRASLRPPTPISDAA